MIMTRTLLLAAAAVVALTGIAPAVSAKSSNKGAVPTACDRDCLKALADSYIASLVAHDPGKVPLAADVKIVENAQRIKPGEGLWKTATAGPTEFKIVVPDPYSQEV